MSSKGKVLGVTLRHKDGTPAAVVTLVNATKKDAETSSDIFDMLRARYPEYVCSLDDLIDMPSLTMKEKL